MDEILELEHAGWRALCTGTGAEHYGAVMTEDAIMVLASGDVLRRDDVVAALADAPPWDTYTIDEPVVMAISDDVMAVVYTGTGTRGDTTFRGAMSSVYVRTPDAWQLALYQQTSTGS
jgi:hypothetical protein